MGAGTGFRDDAAARAFFTPGRQYRARGFVATSYFKYTAQDFIKRVRSPAPARIGLGRWRASLQRDCIRTQVRMCVRRDAHRTLASHRVQVVFADPVNACVLWRIELDLVRGCNYVNFVEATHVEVRRRYYRTALVCIGLACTSKVH
jgi:hypothetical protein